MRAARTPGSRAPSVARTAWRRASVRPRSLSTPTLRTGGALPHRPGHQRRMPVFQLCPPEVQDRGCEGLECPPSSPRSDQDRIHGDRIRRSEHRSIRRQRRCARIQRRLRPPLLPPPHCNATGVVDHGHLKTSCTLSSESLRLAWRGDLGCLADVGTPMPARAHRLLVRNRSRARGGSERLRRVSPIIAITNARPTFRSPRRNSQPTCCAVVR